MQVSIPEAAFDDDGEDPWFGNTYHAICQLYKIYLILGQLSVTLTGRNSIVTCENSLHTFQNLKTFCSRTSGRV